MRGRPKKPVVQLGYDGFYHRSFDSIIDAAYYLKLNPSTISKVCRHKINSTGGYRFMFKEEYWANQIIMHNH